MQKHNRMKRSLANAFSSKALLEQEEIVQQCIDGFIKRLARDGNTPKGLNMTDWYEMIAFDILGEMAFGETFHCVEQGMLVSRVSWERRITMLIRLSKLLRGATFLATK